MFGLLDVGASIDLSSDIINSSVNINLGVNWGNSSAGISIGLKPIGAALTAGSVLLKRLLPGTLIPAPASFAVPVNAEM